MKATRLLFAALLAATATLAGAADSANSAPVATGGAQQVYGSQLMTAQERQEFRTRMRAAKTVEERARIREEHHAAMQERAKERGVTLPDSVPGSGGGMGGGAGMGPNRGMGGGRPGGRQ
ncbi:MAG: hypothetical protein KGI67_06695 [Pseudomonadota bacterium]|nr:hypothetical protein [Pseudomonadota bacterium]